MLQKLYGYRHYAHRKCPTSFGCFGPFQLPLIIVYDLKCVGPLEFELIAPMPEQLKTTTMHFYVLGWVQRNLNFGSSDRRLLCPQQ